MNKVILMGRLTKDVSTRYTSNGKIVANFTLAIRRKYQNEGRTADFISCIAWGKQAEFINHYFGKGSMILVEGRLQSSTWGTQDGKTNYSTEVIVDEVYFTGDKTEKKTESSNTKPTQATGVDIIEKLEFDNSTDSTQMSEVGKAI